MEMGQSDRTMVDERGAKLTYESGVEAIMIR